MAPRTNACHCIQRLKEAAYHHRNGLYINSPCLGFSRHNSTPRLRRDLHATHRAWKSSRSSVTTSIPVSRNQLDFNRCRRHAIWARKSLSLPRGARGLFNTHTLRSNATEDSGGNLQVESGDADVSISDSTVSGNENDIAGFETSLSPAARKDIKTFRHLWNRKIIRLSRDLKLLKDKGNSKFKLKLRIPNGMSNAEETKLRVRGEIETTSTVRTFLPTRIVPLFHLTL